MGKLFLTLLLIFSSFAQATNGRDGGNGGDVVICSTSSGDSYEILDSFEVTKIQKLDIDLGDETLSLKNKIKLGLDRISGFAPQLNMEIQSEIENIINGYILTSIPLVDIPDTGD